MGVAAIILTAIGSVSSIKTSLKQGESTQKFLTEALDRSTQQHKENLRLQVLLEESRLLNTRRLELEKKDYSHDVMLLEKGKDDLVLDRLKKRQNEVDNLLSEQFGFGDMK